MSEIFPGYTEPTVGMSVLLPDGVLTGTIRAYERYNGEGYFCCAVEADVSGNTGLLDVYQDPVTSVWKSRIYNQIRYPDLDGVRKDM